MQWKRDPGIGEMVEYFDQIAVRQGPQWSKMTTSQRWGVLKKAEKDAIELEMRKCRDFRYASRNYFWIADKDGVDIPFALWSGQMLVLEKIEELWEKRPDRCVKLFLLKARQLGASTLLEGLIAWRTMFFPNTNAIVVSRDKGHSAYLFGIMLHIYDWMPWWLKPDTTKKKVEDGLEFNEPNEDVRRTSPGLNSMITVQPATKMGGVGQGYKLSGAHVSELADYDQEKAKEIIEGDLKWALADSYRNFGVIETTAKGSGTYTERLWLRCKKNEYSGSTASWLPLFLPAFFEKRRTVTVLPQKWQAQKQELDLREKVRDSWTQCDNPKCRQYRLRRDQGEDAVESPCKECSFGVMREVVLTDNQLCWFSEQRTDAENGGLEAIKELKQEICMTPEEAFQIHGVQVFPQACHDFVAYTVKEPIAWGSLDENGAIHYVANFETMHCALEWCEINHKFDDEHPLKIWEFPEPGAEYCIGADIAEGLGGDADYSVAFVNKKGRMGPDEQVAIWRSNTIPVIDFARTLNYMGRIYNEALMAPEANMYDTVVSLLRLQYSYPNMWLWKHYDSKNILSQKFGWYTQQNSKPKLWQTGVYWLKTEAWIVRDEDFAFEMKRFQKDDYEDRGAGAEVGFHDDVIMSGLISLFCAHDTDYNDSVQFTPYHRGGAAVVPTDDWTMHCGGESCPTPGGHTWGAKSPEDFRYCPACGSIRVSGKRKTTEDMRGVFKIEEMGVDHDSLVADGVRPYSLL